MTARWRCDVAADTRPRAQLALGGSCVDDGERLQGGVRTEDVAARAPELWVR